MILFEQRKKVIEIAQKAQDMGLIILTTGNFSLRDRDTGYVCLTPSGMNYRELEPADIPVVDLDGNIIEGIRRPSIESPMHREVYRKRADVFGVCHTHSPYATAWASVDEEFPLVLAELAAMLGGPLKTAPYRTAGTPELAETVTMTLGEQNAVLMGNHGLLAAGADIDKAFANAFLVEEAAKVAYYAKGIGQVRKISEKEAVELKEWLNNIYGQR